MRQGMAVSEKKWQKGQNQFLKDVERMLPSQKGLCVWRLRLMFARERLSFYTAHGRFRKRRVVLIYGNWPTDLRISNSR